MCKILHYNYCSPAAPFPSPFRLRRRNPILVRPCGGLYALLRWSSSTVLRVFRPLKARSKFGPLIFLLCASRHQVLCYRLQSSSPARRLLSVATASQYQPSHCLPCCAPKLPAFEERQSARLGLSLHRCTVSADKGLAPVRTHFLGPQKTQCWALTSDFPSSVPAIKCISDLCPR